jgi:hypothetical protein
MVQLSHIQYTTKYFIKFDHCLNGFWTIFTLCNILLEVLYCHNLFFNHLTLIIILFILTILLFGY